MPRPAPPVILDQTNPKTHMIVEIVEAPAIYAILYDGQPINLRTRHSLIEYPGPKYARVSFSNPGHAHNTCERLNEQFRTDLFKVHVMTMGEVVVETHAQRLRSKRKVDSTTVET
jgi:hypothetical protein